MEPKSRVLAHSVDAEGRERLRGSGRSGSVCAEHSTVPVISPMDSACFRRIEPRSVWTMSSPFAGRLVGSMMLAERFVELFSEHGASVDGAGVVEQCRFEVFSRFDADGVSMLSEVKCGWRIVVDGDEVGVWLGDRATASSFVAYLDEFGLVDESAWVAGLEGL